MNNFFIVGMPASGKSKLGKFISSHTKLEFIDLDIEIEKTIKMKVSEIFENRGEEYFRMQETKVLKGIIRKEENFILSTGGGTPYFNDNMSLINKSGISLFIDVDKKILLERISRNNKRPLLKNTDNLEEKISQIYNERISFYKKSKHHLNSKIREQALSIINSYS